MTEPAPAFRIGIDFGTTNSSIGLARGGSGVELVRFPQNAGIGVVILGLGALIYRFWAAPSA